MSKKAKKTTAETNLLDLIKHNKQASDKEQIVKLTKAVDAVFDEAMKDAYRLSFDELDGIRLETPSGVTFIFSPKNKLNEWDMELIVIGITAETNS